MAFILFFFLTVVVYISLRFHTVHSRFLTCATRTDTRLQTHFPNLRRFRIPHRNARTDRLPAPIVSFVFEPGASVLVAVPFRSGWFSLRVYHRTQEMCRQMECVSGTWFAGSTQSSRHGVISAERPLQWHSFSPGETRRYRQDPFGYDVVEETSRLRLSGSEKAWLLDHQLVSAVQDAELYFNLCSTPMILRLLYMVLRLVWARAADWLAFRVLWVQLRAMSYRGDTYEYQGRFTLFRMCYLFAPPSWVVELEDLSEHWLSTQVLRSSHWVGTRLLGMECEYEEYKLSPNACSNA
ncbi:hypothetical protein PWT90_07069 [Aphanocladium album]|nr:hypothetical protein PWT90_07069 [Aphanocladium album]